jgi:hypothetical protein
MRTVPQLAAAVLLVGLATSGGATEPVSPAQPGPTYDLEFSTFLGGSGQDQIRDVATDSPGNIYLVGGTVSPDFPTTPGAYQRIHNPGNPDMSGTIRYDIFVTKLDATGRLLWSTLVGGRNYDRAYAVAADSQGFVYVAGRAGRGFPVTPGAFQTAFMGTVNANPNPYGEQDGVIFKLKPDGSDLVWASYFGADDAVIVRDMSIDRGGNAYLATGVLSSTVNVPPGWSTWFSSGFQKSPQGGRDSIVAKISPDGSRVVWASFFGGSGDDSHNPTIAVDENGSASAFGRRLHRASCLPTSYAADAGYTRRQSKVAPAGTSWHGMTPGVLDTLDLQRLDEAFHHGDAAMLAHRPKPGVDPFSTTPILEALTPELLPQDRAENLQPLTRGSERTRGTCSRAGRSARGPWLLPRRFAEARSGSYRQ